MPVMPTRRSVLRVRGARSTAQPEERRLRRGCETRLDTLGVHAPYDLAALLARVSATRGRAIRLLPLAAEAGTADGCSGLWAATDTEDWIFIDQDAAGDYRDLIIAHELAHIVCEHPADMTISDADLRLLAPTLDPDRVRSALRRTKYDTHVEREAEMLGSLILARAEAGTAIEAEGPGFLTPEAPAVLARLSQVLK